MEGDVVRGEFVMAGALGAVFVAFIAAWFVLERLLDRAFTNHTIPPMYALPPVHRTLREARPVPRLRHEIAPAPMVPAARAQYVEGLVQRLGTGSADAALLDSARLVAWTLGMDGAPRPERQMAALSAAIERAGAETSRA